MLSHYKTPLSRLGDPVARVLLQAHVRPNHLTVLGLGVSIVAAGALAGGRLRVGAVLTNLAALQRILYTRAAPAPASAPVVPPIAAAAPVRAPAEPDATRLRPSA